MRHVLIAFLAVVALTALPARGAGRLFKAFDFEERQLGNDEDVPMHWSKLSAVDLPHYVVGRLSTDRARSGRYSFRIDLDGGSCIYQYDPARLPVAMGGHYRLSGYCQTTALAHARGRLTLALADAAGYPIAGTEVHSDLCGGDAPADDWRYLSAELTDATPSAASLVIRLELVQPARYAPPSAGDRSVLPEDIRGSAWFDDVVVAQVPRVSLATDRPANVFRRGDVPQLTAVLADPSTDDLTSQLVVTDALGRRVYQRTQAVDLSAAEEVAPGQRRVAVPLPVTPAGWYRATFQLATPGNGSGGTDDTAATGSQSIDYVQLADDGTPAAPDPRFGLVATALPVTPALADVLPLLSAGFAKLTVTDGEPFNDTVERLAARGVRTVGCLPLATADPTGVISRHLGQIDAWQMGPDDTDAFVTDPAARRAYARTLAAFAALSGHPDLAMPCPLGFAPPVGKQRPVAVTLAVPPSVLPAEIPAYLRDVTDRVASVSLEPTDAAAYGPDARVADLVERVVYGLSAGVARVDLPVPLDGPSLQPTDLFVVERTLVTALSGAACYGRLPVADGVDAFLFQRPGGPGLVVCWADGGNTAVTTPLGEHLVRTDPWGNATPLPPGAPVVVGRVPTILSGVDAPLARFRAGVTLDGATLESVLLRPQVRRLHLTNPYAQPIAGTVRLRGPAGWGISPPTVRFELAAGESLVRDVGIDLPANARAGRNVIAADVELQADATRHLSLPLVVAVGLSDVGVQTTAFRDGPVTVIVQQRITNYGDHPVDYDAYVACPGQPRVERLVTGLAPGQTVLKRYRFVVTAPGDVRLRAGLREVDGNHVLNEDVVAR